MLSEAILNTDYEDLRRHVGICIHNGDLETALKLIELMGYIAYQFNFLPGFADPDLENQLSVIADRIGHFQIQHNSGKVLFYDYFGIDNRGLTQQYLRALMQLGKPIVYVLESPPANFEKSDIFAELNKHAETAVYCLKSTDRVGKIKEVIEILLKESVKTAFLHLAPWDVVAGVAFNSLKGITRYQINLTDHAFWLGESVTDISLEFRSFGASLSIAKRNIDAKKIRILPYYPIINEHPFEGFPAEAQGKKIIFSGASVYKILGENLIFLHLVKRLLAVDEQLVFMFAGSGNMAVVQNFIETHDLKNRFFLLNNRKDISAVLRHSDYCLTTFPLTGALMTQIAAAVGIPVFFFSKEGYDVNELQELFYKWPNIESFYTVDRLIERFSEIYLQDAYLQRYSEALKQSMITPDEFTQALNQILNGNNPFAFLETEKNVDGYQQGIFEYLLESENKYNPLYEKLIKQYLTARERSRFLPRFFKKEQMNNLKNDKIALLKNYYRLIFP